MSSFLTWLFNINAGLQKLAALLFALIFGALLSLLFIFTSSHMADMVSENIEKRELLGKLQRIVELKSDLEKSKTAENSYDDIFLRGDTISVAGANLYAIVDGMTAANKVSISSVTNLPIKDQSGVELVGLKLVVIGSLENVHKVIFGIETASPPLLVHDMAIQSVRSQSKLVEPNIAVNVEIYGAKRPQLETTAVSIEP